MADFNQLFIVYLMFLFGINILFGALSTLPGDQYGRSFLFSDISTNSDFNRSINTYVETINKDLNTPLSRDTNVEIQTEPNDMSAVLFNIGNQITGGGLGILVKLKDFLIQMLFGYAIWIDYFLNPKWHPFMFYIGTLIKAVISIIQIYAIVSLFLALVGRRL